MNKAESLSALGPSQLGVVGTGADLPSPAPEGSIPSTSILSDRRETGRCA